MLAHVNSGDIERGLATLCGLGAFITLGLCLLAWLIRNHIRKKNKE